jgi:hypothetical protein
MNWPRKAALAGSAAESLLAVPATNSRHPNSVFDALDYQAPFLVDRLLKQHFVTTGDEARALFTEVKRYLVLSHVDQTKSWKMHSSYVDEAWHQFILFTSEYNGFCTRYFGHYLHHFPSNAPSSGSGGRPPDATFAEFAGRYREVFGSDLPDIWSDSRLITTRRRVLNQQFGQLTLRPDESRVEVVGRAGAVLLSVNDIARTAMEFIVGTEAFYVRELPAVLTDVEKIGLVSALVESGVLRVG